MRECAIDEVLRLVADCDDQEIDSLIARLEDLQAVEPDHITVSDLPNPAPH